MFGVLFWVFGLAFVALCGAGVYFGVEILCHSWRLAEIAEQRERIAELWGQTYPGGVDQNSRYNEEEIVALLKSGSSKVAEFAAPPELVVTSSTSIAKDELMSSDVNDVSSGTSTMVKAITSTKASRDEVTMSNEVTSVVEVTSTAAAQRSSNFKRVLQDSLLKEGASPPISLTRTLLMNIMKKEGK